MFEFQITSRFVTKTEEQAEYIRKFLQDAESLMTCESSYSVVTPITESTRI